MAELAFTPAQHEAAEHEGSALLVAAGAGSGKTKVLVERLMRRITGPDAVDIDRFLVITYTRAAAAELKARISDELTKRLAQAPRERTLRRQISLLARAHIGTIHSFCSMLVRTNAHLLDVRPDSRVPDKAEISVLRDSVLEDLLEKKYAEMTEPFRQLVDTLGAGRDDAALVSAILDTYDAVQSHPYPELWLSGQIAGPLPEGDAGMTPWGALLLEKARKTVEYWLGRMSAAADRMRSDGKVFAARGDSFLETVSGLRAFTDALKRGWDAATAFGGIPFPRVKPLKAEYKTPEAEVLMEERKRCKAAMEKIRGLFSLASAELIADIAATRPATDELFRLVIDFGREFSSEKRKRGLLEYSDLEHLALKILYTPEGEYTPQAAEISERYEQILVDEYQDVNRVQDMIFGAVSKSGRNLVMVGDVKQSIYRFRLADPTIFLEKYAAYSDKPASGEPKRLLLTKNFRSKALILKAVNDLFSSIMSEDLGEMEYTEREFLSAGREVGDESEPAFELDLLDISQAPEGTDRVNAEAEITARRIKALLDSGMQTEGKPIRPGDIAILMRSPKGRDTQFVKALAALGIPAAARKSASLFDDPETSTLISLLSITDNPLQDVPLIAVLRSPLFGFTADELALIREADKTSDFYTALVKRAQVCSKCEGFLNTLGDFRDKAQDLGVDRLLRYIFDKTSITAAAGATGAYGGERLYLLLDYARSFEAAGGGGLFGFINQLRVMSEQEENSLSITPAATGREVSVISIHGSKGLEFPVVVLSNLAGEFNNGDLNKKLLIHQDLGAGPKRTDTDRRIEYATLPRIAIRQKLKNELLSEEMRLLYVAMTRARDKLICVCTSKAPAQELLSKLSLKASLPVDPNVLENCRSMAEWMLLASLPLSKRDPMWKPVIYRYDGETEKKAQADAQSVREPDEEDIRRISQAVSYRYPWKEAASLPSKITATGLGITGKAAEAAEEAHSLLGDFFGGTFTKPGFVYREMGLTAAERGTAIHRAVQFIDLNRCLDIESAEAELLRLKNMRFIREEEAAAVDPMKIVQLVLSPIGVRIRNAQSVRREFKFSLLVRADELLGRGGDEKLLLQGVIDCFIEEDGELTLIDFKSDHVTAQTQEQKAITYLPQLSAYSLALRRITNKPVRQSLVYFFATGCSIDISENGGRYDDDT